MILLQYNVPKYSVEPFLFGLMYKVVEQQLKTNGYVDYTQKKLISLHFSLHAAKKDVQMLKEL